MTRLPKRMLRFLTRHGRAAGLGLCAIAAGSSMAGCSTTFWRRQADMDSYALEAEAVTDPRWAVPRFDINPHPESRFAEPHNPDCQPLPPDDAAAHEYMNCVDGWPGYGYWKAQGQSLFIANPSWRPPMGTISEVAIPELSLPEAIELSLLHNREYQFQLEDVYLQALAVSFEQFRLGVRYLGFSGPPGLGAVVTALPGRGRDNSVDTNANFGIQQLLPSGGQLIAELANDTLFLFGGGAGPDTTLSALSWSFTQPLLAGAGRKVNLERLTQAQRNLLYSIRDLARFRREFFTDVVATGAGSGYLGLLEQTQGIRNQIDNIRRLERQVDIERANISRRPKFVSAPLAALPEGLRIPDDLADQLTYNEDTGELRFAGTLVQDDIDRLNALADDDAYLEAVAGLVSQASGDVFSLDVLQLETQLAESIQVLRSQQRRLQDSLDSYKLLLGLPTDFPLGIDDELLQPFQFIAEELVNIEQVLLDYASETGAIDDEDPDPAQMRAVIDGLRSLERRVEDEVVSLVEADLRQLRGSLDERLAAVDDDQLRARLRSQFARDERQFANVREFLAEIETTDKPVDRRTVKVPLAEQELLLDEADELAERAAELVDPLAAAVLERQAKAILRTVVPAITEVRFALLQATQTLTAIQIGVRSDFVSVQPVDLTIEEAVRIGLENRLDLMNARGRVTDAWRAAEIAKNQLKGNVSIVVDGDILTEPGDDALNFSRNRANYRAGIQFDTPLDKLDERNVYRASQIAFQRSRRNYIAFEDTVKFQIRQSWRQLEVLRRNLETAKQQVRIAALQLDVAVLTANAPATRASGGSNGLQGQNLTRALGDILSAQNRLIGNYISYETNRLQLYRDMGIMEIGRDGVWEDAFYRDLTGPGFDGDADDAAEDDVPAVLPLPDLLPPAANDDAATTTLRLDPPAALPPAELPGAVPPNPAKARPELGPQANLPLGLLPSRYHGRSGPIEVTTPPDAMRFDPNPMPVEPPVRSFDLMPPADSSGPGFEPDAADALLEQPVLYDRSPSRPTLDGPVLDDILLEGPIDVTPELPPTESRAAEAGQSSPSGVVLAELEQTTDKKSRDHVYHAGLEPGASLVRAEALSDSPLPSEPPSTTRRSDSQATTDETAPSRDPASRPAVPTPPDRDALPANREQRSIDRIRRLRSTRTLFDRPVEEINAYRRELRDVDWLGDTN